MRRILIIAGLLLTAVQTAQAFQNEPTGFRGIQWGTPLITVAGMSSAPDGSAGFYTRADVAMTIGGAHLKDISYKFYHDQFAGVMLRTPENSAADEEAIIAAFTAQFGQGYKDNQFLKRYLWRGSISTVYLDCNSFTHACTGALLSNQLLKIEEADKAAAARKGAKDF